MPTTLATLLPTGTWNLDPAGTTVAVAVQKLRRFTVAGTLDVTSGSVVIDEDHRVVAVHANANAASYASPVAKRNAHVIDADFLDAAQHPTIVFAADSVDGTGDARLVTGTVTVKGEPAPFSLAVTDIVVVDGVAAFTATGTVERAALGLTKMPSFVIGDTLTVTITARATLAG